MRYCLRLLHMLTTEIILSFDCCNQSLYIFPLLENRGNAIMDFFWNKEVVVQVVHCLSLKSYRIASGDAALTSISTIVSEFVCKLH